MNEINPGQIFLIQTEGPQDSITSTEVVITDLGHIGDDAIVVFEEAVGVGAEETVTGGGGIGGGGGLVTVEDGTNIFHTDDLQCFTDIAIDRSKELVSPDLGSDLGVHYETVETSSLGEGTETVIFRVNLDEDHSDALSPLNSPPALGGDPLNGGGGDSANNKLTDSLDLVKTKSKRSKLLNSDLSKMYLCKLCNSYVDKAAMKTHNRNIHQDRDTLTCSDCGKLFTSKRSLFGHKKEKHSGHTEVFICPDCNKQFSRKSNLKAHRESLHFGKKFPCRVCQRVFTNRSSMNQHVKKTHINLTNGNGTLDVKAIQVDVPGDDQLSDLMSGGGGGGGGADSVDLALLEDTVDPLDAGPT